MSHGGKPVRIESGFEFFAEEVYPAFGRLLRALRVPLQRYPMTYTLYFEDSSKVHLLPPKRPGQLYWPAFAPRSLVNLLRFELLLRRSACLVERRDTSVTIDDFDARFRFPPAFAQTSCVPF